MKKLTALFLLISLLLCSCAKGKKTAVDTSVPEGSEEGIFADLPRADCGGFTFRILNARTASPSSNMDAEEYTGSVIDDEVFSRNLRVEENLNVKIEQERDTAGNVFDKAVNSCLAGDGMYSAVLTTPVYMAKLSTEGYILPIESMKYVNTSKPWWNIDASRELSVAGKMHMLFGDIQPSFFDAHSIVGFNMDIVSETEGIANPYDLADRGEWTLDAMLNMAKSVTADLDGNGERSRDDRFGSVSDGSEIIPLLEGAGKTLTESDSDGIPYVTCDSDESFYDVFLLISDALYSKSNLPFVYDTKRFASDNLSCASMFKSGNVLFYITDIGHLYSLQNMEHEFGLLPVPKENKSQKGYISHIRADSVNALGVPAVLRNADYTFAVIENMAAESHRENALTEKYRDSILMFRYVNDERSRKNLGVVLDTGAFDIGEVYNFGGVADAVKRLCYDTDTYSSEMAKVKRLSSGDILKTVEKLSE